ncbi:hypothetical protein [Actinoplanes sp. NPDC049118]|uniref:hypothetical protein n=1 Tax=Actinoplanes sp. NPDC049118 TaxID=3155769 RepID=UPI0033DE6446
MLGYVTPATAAKTSRLRYERPIMAIGSRAARHGNTQNEASPSRQTSNGAGISLGEKKHQIASDDAKAEQLTVESLRAASPPQQRTPRVNHHA